jgi:hypothetical protein
MPTSEWNEATFTVKREGAEAVFHVSIDNQPQKKTANDFGCERTNVPHKVHAEAQRRDEL